MALVGNGTTATFSASSIGELESVEYSDDTNAVDVTNLSDSEHVFEAGLSNIEVTLTVKGSDPSPSVGDTGALSISWNDGGSDSLDSALVTARSTSTGIDEPITTTLTFVPANA